MCVGRCSRLSSVHTVVVYREAASSSSSFPPLRSPPPGALTVSQDVPATHWRRNAAISSDGPITGPGRQSVRPAPKGERNWLLCESGICFREKSEPQERQGRNCMRSAFCWMRGCWCRSAICFERDGCVSLRSASWKRPAPKGKGNGLCESAIGFVESGFGRLFLLGHGPSLRSPRPRFGRVW